MFFFGHEAGMKCRYKIIPLFLIFMFLLSVDCHPYITMYKACITFVNECTCK